MDLTFNQQLQQLQGGDGLAFQALVHAWFVEQFAKTHDQFTQALESQLTLVNQGAFPQGQKKVANSYLADGLFRINSRHPELDTFWFDLVNYFETSYLLLECKCYSKPLTEPQVLLTEKYLYPKARRSTCLLFSYSGFTAKASETCRSALRDQGKLIIPLDFKDLELLFDCDSKQACQYFQLKLDLLLVSIGR